VKFRDAGTGKEVPVEAESRRQGNTIPGRRHGRTLAGEIALVLVVKLAALILLWFAFFRAEPPPEPARLFLPGLSSGQESLR